MTLHTSAVCGHNHETRATLLTESIPQPTESIIHSLPTESIPQPPTYLLRILLRPDLFENLGERMFSRGGRRPLGPRSGSGEVQRGLSAGVHENLHQVGPQLSLVGVLDQTDECEHLVAEDGGQSVKDGLDRAQRGVGRHGFPPAGRMGLMG